MAPELSNTPEWLSSGSVEDLTSASESEIESLNDATIEDSRGNTRGNTSELLSQNKIDRLSDRILSEMLTKSSDSNVREISDPDEHYEYSQGSDGEEYFQGAYDEKEDSYYCEGSEGISKDTSTSVDEELSVVGLSLSETILHQNVHQNVPSHSFNTVGMFLEDFVLQRTAEFPSHVRQSIMQTVHNKLVAMGIIPDISTRIAPETSPIRSQYRGALESVLRDTIQDLSLPVSRTRMKMIGSTANSDTLSAYQSIPSPLKGAFLKKSPSELFLAGARKSVPALNGIEIGGGYGDLFYEFQILGTGASGRVYKAQHKMDKKWYALKKILLSAKKDWKAQLNEIYTMAGFEHPNIARYYGCWVEMAKTKNDLGSEPVKHADWSLSTIPDPDKYDEEYEDESKSMLSTSKPKVSTTPRKAKKAIQKQEVGWGPAHWEPIDGVYTAPIQRYKLCIAMAFYEKDLLSCITKGIHCFHEEAALPLFLSIVDAVEYVHQAGFVHRDIKPGNIFVQYHSHSKTECCGKPQLIPRIGDFGLVADLARDDKDASKPVGTRTYMPPEGENSRHKSTDIWALGITAIEIFAKFGTRTELYFALDAIRAKDKVPDSLGLSPRIKRLVEGCLDRDPKMRWTIPMIRASVVE